MRLKPHVSFKRPIRDIYSQESYISTVSPVTYPLLELYYPYAHLLETCLQQCKQIQSRRAFRETPQRLLLHALETAKKIHARSLIHGFASKGKLGVAIVDFYAKCSSMDIAIQVFDKLEKKDTLAWNSVLSMYSRHGLLEQVVRSFRLVCHCGVWPNQFTYAIVLSACARLADIGFGRQVHSSIIKMGFAFNSFCEGSLIDMYAKCGCVAYSRQIFEKVLNPDMVSWTAMIAGYVQIGLFGEALKVFEEMQRLGVRPDEVAFVTVLTAWIGLGRLEDACHLFSQMPEPNVVAWNVMISGHARNGCEVEAIEFFQNMMKAGVKASRSTLGSVLSAIANLESLYHGLLVHAQSIKQGLDSNVYVGSSLINMYSNCEKVEASRRVFDALDERNVVLWNTMLGGYAQNGLAFHVLELFFDMLDRGFQPDAFTFTSVLSACASMKFSAFGCQLHSYIIKHKFESTLFVGNALVDMYAKCGALSEARELFERVRSRDKISWNAIIVGYVREEEEGEAFDMFRGMISDGFAPDEVTLASIISACANIHSLEEGAQVHCLAVKSGLETSLYAGSSLIDMYAKCGFLSDAHKIYYHMPRRSVVSMNALISGYAQDYKEQAVILLQEMQVEGFNPTEVTFASILDACSGPSTLNLGMQAHCSILKRGLLCGDEFLETSLLGMYMKSFRKTDACILFSELSNPGSPVLWTVLISGLVQSGWSEEAFPVYKKMRLYNVMPDQATYVSVFRACAVLAFLRNGRELHSLMIRSGYEHDELTASALVDMYAKCGDVKSSSQVFKEMGSRNDVISWNSAIVGCAKNGYAEDALNIYEEMMKTPVKPDDVTFLGVLTACSHAGKVAEGRRIFDKMVNYYGIQPRVDHCACMVDLFGRWGFLKEAEEFIINIKLKSDAMVWATLLGACSIHGDDIRGRWAAEKLIELEPGNSSPYVLLSNIYARQGNWAEANSVRREMRERGLRKLPGCSWIEVGKITSLFVAGDTCHASLGEIHSILKDLTASMKDYGNIAEIDLFFHDGG